MGAMILAPKALPGSADLTHLLNVSRYGTQLALYRAHFPDSAILLLDFDEIT